MGEEGELMYSKIISRLWVVAYQTSKIELIEVKTYTNAHEIFMHSTFSPE